MLEQTILSPIDPTATAFTTPSSQINYWTELLSYNLACNIKALADAGFAFEQAVDADLEAMEDALDNYVTTFDTWLDASVATSSSGVGSIDALPAIPVVVGGVLAKIAGNPLLLFFAKLTIHLAGKWLEKKLDPATKSDELAQTLKELLTSTGDTNVADLLATIQIDTASISTAGHNIATNTYPLSSSLSSISDNTESMSNNVSEISAWMEELVTVSFRGDAGNLAEIIQAIGLDKEDDSTYSSIVSKLQHTPIRIMLTYGGQIDDVTFQ